VDLNMSKMKVTIAALATALMTGQASAENIQFRVTPDNAEAVRNFLCATETGIHDGVDRFCGRGEYRHPLFGEGPEVSTFVTDTCANELFPDGYFVGGEFVPTECFRSRQDMSRRVIEAIDGAVITISLSF
jgi:hypothetical protein